MHVVVAQLAVESTTAGDVQVSVLSAEQAIVDPVHVPLATAHASTRAASMPEGFIAHGFLWRGLRIPVNKPPALRLSDGIKLSRCATLDYIFESCLLRPTGVGPLTWLLAQQAPKLTD